MAGGHLGDKVQHPRQGQLRLPAIRSGFVVTVIAGGIAVIAHPQNQDMRRNPKGGQQEQIAFRAAGRPQPRRHPIPIHAGNQGFGLIADVGQHRQTIAMGHFRRRRVGLIISPIQGLQPLVDRQQQEPQQSLAGRERQWRRRRLSDRMGAQTGGGGQQFRRQFTVAPSLSQQRPDIGRGQAESRPMSVEGKRKNVIPVSHCHPRNGG